MPARSSRWRISRWLQDDRLSRPARPPLHLVPVGEGRGLDGRSLGPTPVAAKIADVGANPFDGVLTDDGNIYLVGLFGEKGVTAIDVWQKTPKAVRFLEDYGKTAEDLPVYKMPHLQGWAFTGNQFVLPAVGAHELLWVDRTSLAEAGRTKTHGQAVFIIAQPASPYVWVNYALPDNDTVEIVDSRTREVVASLKPGPAVLHMEFAPRVPRCGCRCVTPKDRGLRHAHAGAGQGASREEPIRHLFHGARPPDRVVR